LISSTFSNHSYIFVASANGAEVLNILKGCAFALSQMYRKEGAHCLNSTAQISRFDSLRCSQSWASSRQSYSVRSRSFLQRYSNLADGVLVVQRYSSCRRSHSGSTCGSTIPLSTACLPLLSSSLHTTDLIYEI